MWLKRGLDFLLYSHIFIGLCAVAMCWGTFMLFGDQNPSRSYLIFAFCGTVWVYNLHRGVGLYITEKKRWPKRFREFYRLRYFNITFGFLTLVAGLYVFYTALLPYTLYLLPPVLVSLLYVSPLNSKTLLRSLPYIKIFLISFSWAWVSVTFPLLISGEVYFWLILLLSVERFIFIMAIDIPFDIRDYEQDAHESTDTLIHKMGIHRSKQLALLLLVISSLFSLRIAFSGYVPVYYALVHISVYILATILIYYTHRKRPDLYYTFGLDGTMLLLGMLEVIVFYVMY